MKPDSLSPANFRKAVRVLRPLATRKVRRSEKAMHILFSLAPKELHMAVVTAFSTAYISAQRQEIRPHFFFCNHHQRVATCRHLHMYQRLLPNLACEGLPPTASIDGCGKMPA